MSFVKAGGSAEAKAVRGASRSCLREANGRAVTRGTALLGHSNPQTVSDASSTSWHRHAGRSDGCSTSASVLRAETRELATPPQPSPRVRRHDRNDGHDDLRDPRVE